MRVDISIRLRLRPRINLVQAREVAEAWVLRFLDPIQVVWIKLAGPLVALYTGKT